MTDWNAISAFMANVVAWPASATPEAGYVNLHYSIVDTRSPQPDQGAGLAVPSIDEFIKRAGWIAGGHQTMKDVSFCTSRQSQMKLNAKSKPKAVRFGSERHGTEINLDRPSVGPSEPGKKPKYRHGSRRASSCAAVRQDCQVYHPSAIVFSGGGHVYWIARPNSPQPSGNPTPAASRTSCWPAPSCATQD